MLINTVILFIRDTLPVFLLFSFLLAQQGGNARYLLGGTLAGFLMAVGLYFNLSVVSEWFEGGGLELIKTLVLVVMLSGLGEFVRRQYQGNTSSTQWLSALLMVGITFINVIHFIIYLLAYWSASDAGTSLILGNVIGLGISLSVGVLLYVAVAAIRVRVIKFAVLILFFAGQIAGIAMLLEQINLLPNQRRLWDTSGWVADDSEYGHFLNVLIGYEATPTGAYMLICVASILFPVVYCYLCSLLVGKRQLTGELR
ncbi:MAG: FTR1 family iron permease [Alteromonas sp.]|nr:FTR1 family iron permease [Alteromonas sp.]